MEIREASFTAPIAVARQVVGCKVAHASGCLSPAHGWFHGDFMVVHPIIRGFNAMGNSELTWKWWEKVVKNYKIVKSLMNWRFIAGDLMRDNQQHRIFDACHAPVEIG